MVNIQKGGIYDTKFKIVALLINSGCYKTEITDAQNKTLQSNFVK